MWHFSRSYLFNNVAVTITEGQWQLIENDKLITSNILHPEVLYSFDYINKSLFIKYFIIYTFE